MIKTQSPLFSNCNATDNDTLIWSKLQPSNQILRFYLKLGILNIILITQRPKYFIWIHYGKWPMILIWFRVNISIVWCIMIKNIVKIYFLTCLLYLNYCWSCCNMICLKIRTNLILVYACMFIKHQKHHLSTYGLCETLSY